MNFCESSSVNNEDVYEYSSNDEQYIYDNDSDQEYFENNEMFEEEKLRQEEEKLCKMSEIQKIRYLKHKEFLNENNNNDTNNKKVELDNKKVKLNNKKSSEEIFNKLIIKTLNILTKQISNNKPRPLWKSNNYEKTIVSKLYPNFYNYPLVLVDDYTLESFSEELCKLRNETIEKTMTSIDEKIKEARNGNIDYAILRLSLLMSEALYYDKNILKENNDINKKNNEEESEEERK